MSSKIEIISSWESDPEQGFTCEELQILIDAGCIKSQVQDIL